MQYGWGGPIQGFQIIVNNQLVTILTKVSERGLN